MEVLGVQQNLFGNDGQEALPEPVWFWTAIGWHKVTEAERRRLRERVSLIMTERQVDCWLVTLAALWRHDRRVVSDESATLDRVERALVTHAVERHHDRAFAELAVARVKRRVGSRGEA